MKKSFRITDFTLAGINRKMSDLEETLRGVPDTRRVTTATPGGAPIFTAGTAGDPFTVVHKWGKVPTSFTWTAGGDTRIYASGEDRAKWSKDVIVLRGTTPSTQIELTLIAHEDGKADGPEFHGTTTAPVPSTAVTAERLDATVTAGYLQVNGPSVGRLMTVPDAAFTVLYDGGPLGTPSSGSATNLTSFPTLNQDTTGKAAKLAAVTGGTSALTGPTVDRVFTLPDADSTILYSGGALGTPASGNLSSCTFPTLNQNTTGSAGKVKATVSAGNLTINGPTVDRLMTCPDAAFTVLYDGGPLGTPSSGSAANLTSFPTLNQDTTGSAAKLKCTVSAGSLQVNGPTVARLMTAPDAAFTVLYDGGALGTPSSGTLTNCSGTATSLVAGGLDATVSAGYLQVNGPTVARLMTVPDAAFSAARIDAAQSFAGNQTFDTDTLFVDATNHRVGAQTVSPLAWLHVVNDDSFVAGDGARLEGTCPNLQFYTNEANAAARNWALVGNWSSFGDIELVHSTAKGGDPLSSPTTRVAIKPDGNSYINGGLHVGGTADAGDNNLVVDGTINKVTVTTPATGSTLTIADGKTLTANNSLTLAGNDSKTLTVGGNHGVAWAKYSFAVDGGTMGTKTPGAGFNTSIPDNSIITAVTVNVTTAVTSGGSATVAIGTSAGSSTTSLLAATAKASLTLDALLNGVPTFAAPIKLTAAGSITFTIGTADLTAGIIEVFVQYYTAAA